MTLLSLLDRLSVLRGEGRWDEARELASALRPRWRELLREAGEKQGTAARPSFLARLFKLGVFDQVPLSGPPYDCWRLWRQCRAARRSVAEAPTFSLLMPVYNPQPKYFRAVLESILAQDYPHWELCLVDDASPDPAVQRIMAEFAARDGRIRPRYREENGHISAASNSALEMAEGRWCVLVDHDDLLPGEALSEVAAAIAAHPEAVYFFSDEDRVHDAEEEGGATVPVHSSPFFKAGFDPDLLLACNCVSHLGVIRRDVLAAVGGFRLGLEGAQDHDLALRILQRHGSAAFCHIPHVLYHWRVHPESTSGGVDAKPYAVAASLRARQEYAAAAGSAGAGARLSLRGSTLYAQVEFALPDTPPPVHLLVLVEDDFFTLAGDDLRARVAALVRDPGYAGATALLLPVRSAWGFSLTAFEGGRRFEPDFAARLRAWAKAEGLPLADEMLAHAPLFWSQAVNRVVAEKLAGAEPSALVALLRAGDCPVHPQWLQRLAAALVRDEAGVAEPFGRERPRDGVAVAGCRWLNAAGFIVQAGQAVGLSPLSLAAAGFSEGLALGRDRDIWLCPAFVGLHTESAGYYQMAHLLRSAPAVYASGMLVRLADLERSQAFCEETGPLADADFCLGAYESGLGRTIVVPGADLLSLKQAVPLPAGEAFAARWQALLQTAPPFQNPNLDWTAGGWRLRARA